MRLMAHQRPMNPDRVEIKVITVADRDSLKKLYQQAGWWQESDQAPGGDSWVDRLVQGSFCFVGAFSGGTMVGMGRAVSDGASDAYIQDVTVLNEFRGRGIGAGIIDKIVGFLKSRRIGWIGLVAEPGTQAFYQRLGFAVLEGYVPMLLKKQGG
jgi:ribosomal protein S18 acetylase RimI-like enzyme